MLTDVFTFRGDERMASAFEKHVNNTISLIQPLQDKQDRKLPMLEARSLFIVHYGLGVLQEYAPDEEWEDLRADYELSWKQLRESKGYPGEFDDVFHEFSGIESGNIRDIIDIIDPTERLDKEGNLLVKRPAFTTYWILRLLCESLPTGSAEEGKWQSILARHLASGKELEEKAEAEAHVRCMKAKIEEYEQKERGGMDLATYYDKHFALTSRRANAELDLMEEFLHCQIR